MRFPGRVAPRPRAQRPRAQRSRVRRPRGRALRRTPAFVVMLVGLLGVTLVAGPLAPAVATPGTDDYPAYLKAKPRDALVDPWNFYSRECTSFVAWRLNHDNDVHFTNHYLGHHWGDARIWKRAAVDSDVPVNDKPAVGSVAWWSAHSAGSSLGHVAWVLAVNPTSITIEEYNYLHYGAYDTRTITRASSYWPSGFIHVRDLQLRNTYRPTVTGTFQVGKTLVGHNGSWSTRPSDFGYQWRANGKPIAGATKKRFTATAAQLGKRLTVTVTASIPGIDPVSITSAATPAIAPGQFVGSASPVVTGRAQVGQAIAVSTGTWQPTPTGYRYRWYADGTPIAGESSSRLRIGGDLVGERITAEVTARRSGYADATAVTTATAAVAPGTFENLARPRIRGEAMAGETLHADPGAWSPAATTLTYEWRIDGVPVAGVSGPTYTLTGADVGHQVSVGVTAHAEGYTPLRRFSKRTDAVLAGKAAFLQTPRITGSPRLGHTLTAVTGRYTPSDADVTYQWYRGAHRIAGATDGTYRLRPADLGRRVSVRIRLSEDGYAPATRQTARTAVVRSVPRLGVHVLSGHRHHVAVRIEVTAPGVRTSTGRVQVRQGRRVLDSVVLHHGRATARFRLPASGRHHLQVAYAGEHRVLPRTHRFTLRIR